jgi:hypothetical protein
MLFFWVLAPFRLIVSPEYGDGMFLQNVDICGQVYVAPKLRRTASLSMLILFLL